MRKKTMFIGAIFFFVAIACFLLLINTQSAESFLLCSCENAVEVIYQENLGEKKVILFFADDSGSVSCAIIKKTAIGYRTLRVSGRCSISKPGYICSYYNDGGKTYWVSWGLITDKEVSGVVADNVEMKMGKAGAYTFRICWLIGVGNAPEIFTELYED